MPYGSINFNLNGPTAYNLNITIWNINSPIKKMPSER